MKNKILFVLSLLAGLMFINAGLNKFFNYMPAPEDLPQALINVSVAMMEIGWLMPLVAFAEVVGGILIIFKKTRALGAIVLLPVMIGIVLTHVTVAPSGIPMAIILTLVLGWVIVENREKYLVLVR
jgi:uncharacterized membrane protein YphA (DoxX/SURF4 family)